MLQLAAVKEVQLVVGLLITLCPSLTVAFNRHCLSHVPMAMII